MTNVQPVRGPADENRPQDIELYKALLTFVKQRLVYVEELLATPPRRRVELETCALQVRLAMEHLVLSTLVANRPGAEAIVDAFANKNAGEARKLVKRINPKYWPIPFDFAPLADGSWHMAEPKEPYLREEDWGKAYGYCSTLLHAPNPYIYLSERSAKSVGNPQHYEHVARLADYSRRIQRLIKNHQIYLSEIDHSLICHVPEDAHAEPDVGVYSRNNPEFNEAEERIK